MNWVSTVEQKQVGKLVQQSFAGAPRVKLSKPKRICDRSGKFDSKEDVFVV